MGNYQSKIFKNEYEKVGETISEANTIWKRSRQVSRNDCESVETRIIKCIVTPVEDRFPEQAMDVEFRFELP